MDGVDRFIEGLRGLGYAPTRTDGFVFFAYEVEVGPLADETVTLAFSPPADFPLQPPSGPFVSPQLLPVGQPGEHPRGAIHLGSSHGMPDPDGQFQYWSRPFPDWGDTDRSVRTYMHCHIRRLFATLPDDVQRGTHN